MLDRQILRRAINKQQQERHTRSMDHQRMIDDLFLKYPVLRDWENQLKQVFIDGLSGLTENRDDAMRQAGEKNIAIIRERERFLAGHGLSTDILTLTPCCAVCNDTGYDGRELCSCLKRLYIKQLLQELKPTLPYPEASFDSFDLTVFSDRPNDEISISPRENMECMYDICADYAQSFSPRSDNLFFNGPTGTGKTYLSSCIAEALAGRGFNVVYQTAVRCFQEYEAEKFDRSEPGYIRKIAEVDLLVLDDVGTEFITSLVQSAFYDIINTRLTSSKATIINSNLTLEDLRRRYLPQTVSRLEGDYQRLYFFGGDLRLK